MAHGVAADSLCVDAVLIVTDRPMSPEQLEARTYGSVEGIHDGGCHARNNESAALYGGA